MQEQGWASDDAATRVVTFTATGAAAFVRHFGTED
jgi:hypothetical protein